MYEFLPYTALINQRPIARIVFHIINTELLIIYGTSRIIKKTNKKNNIQSRCLQLGCVDKTGLTWKTPQCKSFFCLVRAVLHHRRGLCVCSGISSALCVICCKYVTCWLWFCITGYMLLHNITYRKTQNPPLHLALLLTVLLANPDPHPEPKDIIPSETNVYFFHFDVKQWSANFLQYHFLHCQGFQASSSIINVNPITENTW